MSDVATRDEIGRAIKTFLLDECGVDEGDLDSSTTLFTSDLLSSLDLVFLTTMIEEKFSIEVPMDNVVLEDFDSVELIIDYVLRQASERSRSASVG